jgi:hypothetical protein
MAIPNPAFERAMRLAVVSGLRSMLGPALVAAAHDRPERQGLAIAAMGEMAVDKIPFIPSRSALPLLVPRALAGAWVTKQVMEREGVQDPLAPVIGAAVAAGVAIFAPMVRGTLRRVLGVPDFVIGAAEDYLALKLGTDAVGMSMGDVKQIAEDSVEGVKDRVLPAVHSLGAGSM